LVVRKLPGMSDNYATDENGINYKINEQTSKEVISSDDYFKLKDEEKANYKVDPSGAGFQKVKDRYIDVTDPKSGQFIRYRLNADNTIQSAMLNDNEDVTEATGGKLLSITGITKQAENLKKQYDEQTLEAEKTLAQKKLEMPRQLGLAGEKNVPIGTTKLNIPIDSISPTGKDSVNGNINIEGNIPLDPSKPVTPTIVKPTFASTQTKLNLTPEQNTSAGAAINKAITSIPQIITSTTSPSVIKSQQAEANKKANTLRLATPTPISNPSNTKITLDESYAPPAAPTKKKTLWETITGLFKR
jgi:hypothetical protein